MMRSFFLFLLLLLLPLGCGTGLEGATVMPITGGGGGGSSAITVSCTQTRTSGVAPLVVFFNCTGTTSTYVTSGQEFTHVYGVCNFGDTGSSGTGNWTYGDDSWGKAKNTASGLVCAHLYADAGTYSPTFVAYVIDTGTGTLYTSSTHSFTDVTVTSQASAFPTTATACVSTSGTYTNCPPGANHDTTSDYSAALGTYLADNTRVLFRCGETFTGNAVSVSGSGWRIGAYGSCVGTKTSRPVWQQNGTGVALDIADTVSDIAVSDIDVYGSTNNPGGFIVNESSTNPLQVTFYNDSMRSMGTSYWTYGARQYALVDSSSDGMDPSGGKIDTFVNADEWNAAYSYDYSALIGNSIDGNGGTSGASQEVVRVSACEYCVFTNNYMANSATGGAILKFHAGNTNNSCNDWGGYYTQYNIISDNYFYGTSAAQMAEVAPQNGATPAENTPACGATTSYMDERLRRNVIERNLFKSTNSGGRELYVSGQGMMVRNNVFEVDNNDWGIMLTQRSDVSAYPSTGNWFWNNTCYSTGTGTVTQYCLEISLAFGTGTVAPASNFIENTLSYITSASAGTYENAAGGTNTISNNTTTQSDPSFVNGGGSLALFSDYQPTANYTGGTTAGGVPYDGLGVSWAGTWDYGAIKH